MRKVILCDVDGVLANINHRLHYAKEKNYDEFYSKENMMLDSEFYTGVSILQALQQLPEVEETRLVAGRPKRTSETTSAWLMEHTIIADDVMMRKDGDYRPSDIVKKELVEATIENDKNNNDDFTYIFIDDDPTNVRAVESIDPQHIIGICVGTSLYYKLEDSNAKNE